MSNYAIISCGQVHSPHVCWRPCCHPRTSEINYITSFDEVSTIINSAAPPTSSWTYELTPYASLYAGGASGYDPPIPKMPYKVTYEWRKGARQFGNVIDFGSYKTK